MANRHKASKTGVRSTPLSYGNPKVAAEAKQRARGGRAEGGAVPGKAGGGRLDKRARGGGVGADKSPYSSACLK